MSAGYRKVKGNQGYVVSPDLLEDLTDQLRDRGIEFIVVNEPIGCGEYPRPVFVSDQPKPFGRWTRYGRCPKCKNPRTIRLNGMIVAGCSFCQVKRRAETTADDVWRMIEERTSVRALNLPGWFDDPEANTVLKVRLGLIRKTLIGIGPERALHISDALNHWRQEVVAVLNDSI